MVPIKRILASILTAALLFSICALYMPAYADRSDGAVVSASSIGNAKPGDTVEIDVSISNNPGIIGAKLTVTYDEGLTLKEAVNGDAFSKLNLTPSAANDSPCTFVWDGTNLKPDEIKDGIILKLTFEVSSAITENKKLNIVLSSNAAADWLDTEVNNVPITCVNGAVNVVVEGGNIPSPELFTISFDANDGTGAPAAQTKTQGVALTLSDLKPTRTGYIFLGWATSQTATAAQYQPGDSCTADANITLYAVWQEDETAVEADVLYTVTPEFTTLYRSAGNQTVTYTVRAELAAGIDLRTVTLYIKPPEGMTFGNPLEADGMLYQQRLAPDGIFETVKMEIGTGEHAGEVVILFSGTTKERSLKESAVLGTFTATIAPNTIGEFKPLFGNHFYGCTTENGNSSEALEAAVKAISLTICDFKPGDVNGDEYVTADDMQRLYEYLNGSNPFSEADLVKADVNGDGYVTADDMQRIYEHLNGANPLF